MSDISALTTQSAATTGDVALAGLKTAVGNLNTDKAETVSPSLTTPNLGAATATSINKVAITAPATGATLVIADGKTLTASNSIALAGTDGKGINVGGATAGKILQGDGSNMVLTPFTLPTTAPATGKIIVSDGTNLVASTPTLPVQASATARKKIVSDGTNWVASTETWAVPGSSGNILTSDGTNWLSSPASSGGNSIVVIGQISLAASATLYFDTIGTALGAVSTETDIGFIVPVAGTLSNFYLRSRETLTGTAGQTIVYTIMKNGVASTMVITQTVGDVSQIYSDLTHTLSVAAGDRLTIRAVIGAITSNTGRLSGGGIKLAA